MSLGNMTSQVFVRISKAIKILRYEWSRKQKWRVREMNYFSRSKAKVPLQYGSNSAGTALQIGDGLREVEEMKQILSDGPKCSWTNKAPAHG